MPTGDVIFKLDAQSGAAVNAFLKVVDAQRKTEKAFKRTITYGKRFDKTLQNMGRSMMAFAGSMVGLAGTKMVLGGVIRSLENARRETMQFEDEMTGLLSLGDNVEMIDLMKNRILDLSGAFGITRKSIADTLFNLQSGSAGLSKTIQDDVLKNTLELVKVTGADMPTAMNALLKSYRIFGSETMTVNDIQNKLFVTAEKGYLTFQDMAALLPDLESAAKTFGFSLDEVGGAVITATQKLGRTQVTLTGLRNVFLGMVAAEQKGVKMTNDFAENVRLLSKMDPDFLLKAFGKRTVAVIGALTDNAEELRKNIQTVAQVQGDVTNERYLKRLRDESYLFSEISKSIQEMNKNIVLRKDYVSKFGKTDVEYQMRKLGVEKKIPAWAKDIPGYKTAAAIFSQIFGTRAPLEEGRRELINTYQRQGRYAEVAEINKQYPMEPNQPPALLTKPGMGMGVAGAPGGIVGSIVQELLLRIANNTRGPRTYAHPEVRPNIAGGAH